MSGTDAMPPAEAMAALITRLIQKYGRELISDRRRLLGLMRDYEPTQALAIRLLMGAYDQEVPQIFLSGDAARTDFAIEHAVQTLVQETGIKGELAEWSVACWQKALAAVPAAPSRIAAAPVMARPAVEPDLAPPASAAPVVPSEPPPAIIDTVTLPIGDPRMPEPDAARVIASEVAEQVALAPVTPEPITPEPVTPEPVAAASIAPGSTAPTTVAPVADDPKPQADDLTWGESEVAKPPAAPGIAAATPMASEAPAVPPAVPVAPPATAQPVPPATAVPLAPPVPPVAPPAAPVVAAATVAPPPLQMAPSAPPPVPQPPPAADLTWGESEVIPASPAPIPMAPTVPIAPAIPLAPAVAPSGAVPPAFAQQSSPPPGSLPPGSLPPGGLPPGGLPPGGMTPGMAVPPKSSPFSGANLGYIITALVIIVGAAAYRFDLFGTRGTAPAPETTQPPPTTTAPAPAPQRAPAPAPEAITVIKVLKDPSDIESWPKFPAGNRLGNAVNSWQFKFNMKYLDGRMFVYSASFLFSNNLREGKGVISAIDLRQNTDAMVSQTPALPVTRARVNAGQAYLTSVQATSWDQNPSNAPSVCISFTSGQNASRFEPEQSLFCVNEFKNKTCGVMLGCGRLE